MKRILLVNAGWSDNLGDQAIRMTLERLIEERGFEVVFADLVKPYPRSYEYSSAVEKKGKKPTRSKLTQGLYSNRTTRPFVRVAQRVYQLTATWKQHRQASYDKIIIGGGQLLLPSFVWPLFMWSRIIGKQLGCPVVLFGVGAEGEYTITQLSMLTQILRSVESIYVRDSKSQELIENLFGVSAECIPDVVFCIPEFLPVTADRRKLMLLAPLPYRRVYSRFLPYISDDKEFCEMWMRIAKGYLDEGYEVGLTYSTVADAEVCGRLRQRIATEMGATVTIRHVSSVEELISTLAEAEIVVSGRMHVLILASAYGAEVRPVVISDKLAAFEEEYLRCAVNDKELHSAIRTGLANACSSHASI